MDDLREYVVPVWAVMAGLALVGIGFAVRIEGRGFAARGRGRAWAVLRFATLPIALATAAAVLFPARAVGGPEALQAFRLSFAADRPFPHAITERQRYILPDAGEVWTEHWQAPAGVKLERRGQRACALAVDFGAARGAGRAVRGPLAAGRVCLAGAHPPRHRVGRPDLGGRQGARGRLAAAW